MLAMSILCVNYEINMTYILILSFQSLLLYFRLMTSHAFSLSKKLKKIKEKEKSN